MADEIRKIVVTEFKAEGVAEYERKVADLTAEIAELKGGVEEVTDATEETGTQMKHSLGEGADAVGKLIPGLGGISGKFKQAEEGAKKFGLGTKAAIASTGIGLLVVGLGQLIAKFQEIGDVADEELTFTQKRFKDMGNEAKTAFEKIKTGVVEWIATSKAVQFLRESLAAATKGQSEAVFALIGNLKEEKMQYDANREALILANEQKQKDVRLAEQSLLIARENGVEILKDLELQREILNAKLRTNDADAESIGFQLDILDLRRQNILTLNAEIDAINRKLKATEGINLAESKGVDTGPLRNAGVAQAVANIDKLIVSTEKLSAVEGVVTDAYLDGKQAEKDALIDLGLAGAQVLADAYGAELSMAFVNAAGAIIKVWNNPTNPSFAVKAAQSALLAVQLAAQISIIRKNRPKGTGGKREGTSGGVQLTSSSGISQTGTTTQTETARTNVIANQLRPVLVVQDLRTVQERILITEKLSTL